MQSSMLTFGDFDNFINQSFEELHIYEQMIKNQFCVESYTTSVQTNEDRLEDLSFRITGEQCDQELLDNDFQFLNSKLNELERIITCFEYNFRGPEYLTPKDTEREYLYNFLLCVNAKMINLKESNHEMNTVVNKLKRMLNAIPYEEIASKMMTALTSLEEIDTNIFQLKEKLQEAWTLQMVVMKQYDIKLGSC